MSEEPEDEFRDIMSDILRPELTAEELDEIAARWALNRIRVLRKYGQGDEVDFERLKLELYVRAARLRERLGLTTTSSHRD